MNWFTKAPEAPIVDPVAVPVAPVTPIDGVAPVIDPITGLPTPGEPVTTAPLEGLDRLQQLLDNKPIEGSDNTITDQPDAPLNPVELLSTPGMMDKIMETLDFSTSISPETQTKLTEGTPDAIISLVQDVSKAAYSTALKHSSVLSQKALDDRMSVLEKSTGHQITKGLDKHELNRELPQMNNPLVSMAVENFQEKLAAQNPMLSQADIAAETRTYLAALSKAVNPDQQPKPEDEEDGVDWLADLGITG